MKPLSRRTKLGLSALAAAGIVAGLTAPAYAAPTSPANSRTYCVLGQNANTVKSGSTYYAQCHPNGGWVAFELTVNCQAGGGGTTDTARGSGYATVATGTETCWFGGVATGLFINNT